MEAYMQRRALIAIILALLVLAGCSGKYVDTPHPSSMASAQPDPVFEYFAPEFVQHGLSFARHPKAKIMVCVDDFRDKTQRFQIGDGHGAGGYVPEDMSMIITQMLRALGFTVSSRTEIERARMTWEIQAGRMTSEEVPHCDVIVSGQFTNVTPTSNRSWFFNIAGIGAHGKKGGVRYTGDIAIKTVGGITLADSSFNQQIFIIEGGGDVGAFLPTSIGAVGDFLVTGAFAQMIRENPDIAQRLVIAVLTASVASKFTCITGWQDKLEGVIPDEPCPKGAESSPIERITLRSESLPTPVTEAPSHPTERRFVGINFPLSNAECCSPQQLPFIEEAQALRGEGCEVVSVIGLTCPKIEADDPHDLRLKRALAVIEASNALELGYLQTERLSSLDQSLARSATPGQQRAYYELYLPKHPGIKDHGAAIIELLCPPRAKGKEAM